MLLEDCILDCDLLPSDAVAGGDSIGRMMTGGTTVVSTAPFTGDSRRTNASSLCVTTREESCESAKKFFISVT